MFKWITIGVLLLLPLVGICQIKDLPAYQYNARIFITSTDSLIHVQLPEISVYPRTRKMSKREFKQYTTLEMRVKKVYPIAKLAGKKIAEYNQVYLNFKSNRERKEYVKNIEKQLFAEYEHEIKTMSISQGRILIKLIDRETGESSYEIIKEFKGGFSAFLWQGVARIFGHNLKDEYDAINEDRMIEYIIWKIDTGMI